MNFFSHRLAGHIPLRTLFWRDMVTIGTTASFACLAASLVLAAAQAPIWLIVIVFLLPIPYNGFIWHCVWKLSGRMRTPERIALRALATTWLAIMVFV